MNDHSENDKIYQMIVETNSNIQRYLDLAPRVSPVPLPQSQTLNKESTEFEHNLINSET